MTDSADWVKKKLLSGELSYKDVSDLARVVQSQNDLVSDGLPGPVTMQKVRELLVDMRRTADTERPPAPEAQSLPNVSLPSSSWLKGIDVSHHQQIAYDKLPNYLEFAFVKATEGTTGLDTAMLRHLSGLSLKVPRLGLYHFARPSTASQGRPDREAQNFVRMWVDAMKIAGRLLPPVLDIEDERKVPAPSALVDWCAAWCAECERLTGRTPIIYTYASYLAAQLKGAEAKLSKHLLWLADYRKAPPASPDGAREWPWTFWQYSSTGAISGVNGSCDLNVVRTTVSQLDELYL